MISQSEKIHTSIIIEDADICIIGGGVGGLSLSILLAGEGFKVVLLEKETYPYHKVCGEYVSRESWGFLEKLGVPLNDYQLPVITKLMVTSPNGHVIMQDLELGGFGISRFKLDHTLSVIARKNGVELYENCKATDLVFSNDGFIVTAGAHQVKAKVCVGSFGKKANFDTKWKRSFVQDKPSKLNNYIGIKYHVKADFPGDMIALHNFENGYCGLSKIEDDKYCCCYLTTAENLRRSHNNIREMEQTVLHSNPFLKSVFRNMEILYEEPLVISQVSFAKKSCLHEHVILLGDAAGMIAPLCGNGMSMAMHAAKIAAGFIHQFLNGLCTREQMEDNYQKTWNSQFGPRLRTGRLIQTMFGKSMVTDLFVRAVKPFPGIINTLIRKTHGEPF